MYEGIVTGRVIFSIYFFLNFYKRVRETIFASENEVLIQFLLKNGFLHSLVKIVIFHIGGFARPTTM